MTTIVSLTINKGEVFIIEFEDGRKITLSWAEWMDLRRLQNSLIFTEPV